MSRDPGTGDASQARYRLLSALIEEFGNDLPAPDLSLREVASRIGTSHALLRYHFGSYAGLLAAMLSELRQRDNASLRSVAETASFAEFIEVVWRHYGAAEGSRRAKSFFYVAGLAVHDHETFAEFISSLEELTVLLASIGVREGASEQTARLHARLAIAALRGLLLEKSLADAEGESVIRLLQESFSRATS